MIRNKKLLSTILIVFAMIAGCSSTDDVQQTTSVENESIVSQEDVLSLNWDEIVDKAKGTKVNFFLWGGDEGVNRYIDEWVAPRLKEQYDIELTRYPMDAQEFINKLLSEKKANKEKGDIDLLWLNGENFKTAKENGLLFGPIASKIPNFNEFVDGTSPDVMFDFGYPTEGYEVPWGKVQFAFAYDSSKISDPPQSLEELEEWVKAHPGKFTYPAPPDFTGSAFIRHVLYETSTNDEAYLGAFDEAVVSKDATAVWEVLNDMKPYLWREGNSYPQSVAQLEQLYKNGEVWMTMGYDEANASNLIKSGEFPETTKTFLFKNGTLANTHFVTVPFNTVNPYGALVTIDFLLSPAAQLKKMDLEYWGENIALNVDWLPDEYIEQLENIDRGPATLSQNELESHRLPEMNAHYVEWLERGWIENVAK
ncbi:ABC transporter substrate-binding protein [Calidifontibacillus oryziterrae]|uniref:ABC transporter substrate-binding protein n=1 Tax=Calidifontibacillus oryziterrae TaxID=1191699 RepID=UPI00030DCCFA|nr:ABC transporter substrate-binding protein [Calidifontibacillus oryziterrae]